MKMEYKTDYHRNMYKNGWQNWLSPEHLKWIQFFLYISCLTCLPRLRALRAFEP